MSKKILYFAYGSNLNKEQMLKRCPDTVLLSDGILKNYRLNTSRKSDKCKGFISIEECNNSIVNGFIFQISQKDLNNLDKFEGCPFVYDRKMVNINYNGKIYKCYCYITSELLEDNIHEWS